MEEKLTESALDTCTISDSKEIKSPELSVIDTDDAKPESTKAMMTTSDDIVNVSKKSLITNDDYKGCKQPEVSINPNSENPITVQSPAQEPFESNDILSTLVISCAAQVVSSATLDDKSKISSQESTAGILSLPIDSLHHIASFLSPREWCNGFGLSSKTSATLSREIVRRVRLHGFKCAAEVVTAFKMGQISDAKELAALYISSGVPIYARCRGHSYHTIHWRIQVESRETQKSIDQTPSTDTGNENSSSSTVVIDPFYHSRLEIQNRAGYRRELTYLEEKCLFFVDKNITSDSTSSIHRRRAMDFPNSPRTSGRSNTSLTYPTLDSSDAAKSPSETSSVAKIPMPIHHHLFDQHKLGNYYVNDCEGKMVNPMVSLSADFFHPVSHRSGATSRSRDHLFGLQTEPRFNENPGSGVDALDLLVSHELQRSNAFPSLEDNATDDSNAVTLTLGRAGNVPDSLLTDALAGLRSVIDDARRLLIPEDNEDDLFQPPQQPTLPAARIKAALNSIELEVYSSSLNQNLSSFKTTNSVRSETSLQSEIKRHLRSRFATYQRRLEGFLAQGCKGSSCLFDECLLDFWDEFFPHTADIHYYDTETAVPRISCLQKFLTKPCPQAIGVVQCEIERIRIGSRGKGVNMKGRLFPTYEYRLFIRNRPPSSPENFQVSEPSSADEFVRRDTVLMVAKNRGRKHAEVSGVFPISSSSKKGSNNYYLYMPKQMDVDDHFNKVNNNFENLNEKPLARLQPNGVSHDPVLTSDDAGSILLGRLQSNFIGTEFQIFTPRPRKVSQQRHVKPNTCPRLQNHQPCSEDELDYDSGVSSDTNNNPMSVRRSRFGRLSLRRSQQNVNNSLALHQGGNAENPVSSAMSDTSSPYALDHSMSRTPLMRTLSSPDLSNQRRQTRTNRRAVANSSNARNICLPAQICCEEENGAITYTANLLGSRPRIMDVCIPKVTPDGASGLEWKKYVETFHDNSENHDTGRMLSCFRQLQQRRESLDQNNAAGVGVGQEAIPNEPLDAAQRTAESDGTLNSSDDFGLMVLQNRPPWWNVELGSFVLNFGGRVSVASVKNFQLCERTDQDRIMLQFGRIQGRHSFTMDFQHPLTAVQAFSIAISSLQSKISFG